MENNYNDRYGSIMLNTLGEESYYTNGKKLNTLKKLLREKNVFKTEKMNLNEIDLLKLFKSEDDELEKRKFIKVVEEYELYKPYYYGIMYKYDGEISKEKISEREIDKLFGSPRTPKLIENENFIYLKFSLVLKNQRESQKELKYPVVSKFYKKEKHLVIFFDMLRDAYQMPKVTKNGVEHNIYSSIVDKIENWINKNLGITLENHPAFTATNILSRTVNERDDLEEFTEYSYDDKNGNQKLRADLDGKLPFYSKLEEVIESLPDEKSKEMLKDFLINHKETSDYYQRGFKWLFDDNKKIKMELKKKIFNDERDLLYFQNHNLEVKEVDYVIRDIIEASRLYSEAIASEEESNSLVDELS